ncbi:MAG: cobyrinate a,c-diamide synthase [Candidatus Omnitrophota bacterium]|nr:cobyrinate a,c-diamide synthase [Candidatus Omnitrophota bacterium]
MSDSAKKYPRLVLAGTHSSVGKTTVALAVLMALKKRGLSVQPFKVGPDYIDPSFHSKIAGRACRNLDSFFLGRDALLELFQRQAREVSLSIIEGVMGLYDGLGENSRVGSTADIAGVLNAPVILIVDAGKMAASAGAVVLGYRKFDPGLHIAGCILNRIAGESHYQIAKRSIEAKSDIKVLGYLPKRLDFALPERHLGLTPAQEIRATKIYEKLSCVAEEHIDMDKIICLAKNSAVLPGFKPRIFSGSPVDKKTAIAVARDESFHFYYQDNLDILEHYGARLEYFSPLRSKRLPADAGGLYIGGGFPELFAKRLSDNRLLREEILTQSRRGMPIYAECGGLMYLMKELQTADKKRFPMAGIFPGKTKMGNGLRMFGYYDVRAVKDSILAGKGSLNKGHIFHWSYLTSMPSRLPRAFRVARRGKISFDGYIKNKSLASYIHLHFGCNPSWAKSFVDECFIYKRKEENYV